LSVLQDGQSAAFAEQPIRFEETGGAVRRIIDGFHRDDEDQWVAELSCLHNQHIRHDPPWQERPWVVEEETRIGRIGSELDCPLCDRAELPAGLVLHRTAGPFDQDSLPKGLLEAHRVAARTWGRLRIASGKVIFKMEGNPPLEMTLEEGDSQHIPPLTPHSLTVVGPVQLSIDFFARPR
jgi:tellurite methyltransferase